MCALINVVCRIVGATTMHSGQMAKWKGNGMSLTSNDIGVGVVTISGMDNIFSWIFVIIYFSFPRIYKKKRRNYNFLFKFIHRMSQSVARTKETKLFCVAASSRFVSSFFCCNFNFCRRQRTFFSDFSFPLRGRCFFSRTTGTI